MKYKYLPILLLPFLICTTSKAQNRLYEKGYIVTLKGDTINGYIKKLRISLLNKGVDFRKSMEEIDTAIHYTPVDLLSYCFVANNMRLEQVVYTDIDKNKTVKKLFGLLLVSGKLNLYRLDILDAYNATIMESDNNHIYIIKQNTDYWVLRMNERISEMQYYLATLNKILSNNEKIGNKLDNLGFTDKEMIDVIATANGSSPHTPTIVYNHTNKIVLKHGLTASYFKIHSDPEVINNEAFSVGYFWDILDPGVHEYISLMTGINYFRPSNISHYGANYLTVPVLATVNLSKKKIAPFINFGGTAYLYDFYQLVEFNVTLGIGTYINNKVFIAINTEHQNLSDFVQGNYFKTYWLNFKLGLKLN